MWHRKSCPLSKALMRPRRKELQMRAREFLEKLAAEQDAARKASGV